MPTFQGQVDEEDLIKLIAFIKSLRPGQTPVRTEDATPPVRRNDLALEMEDSS